MDRIGSPSGPSAFGGSSEVLSGVVYRSNDGTGSLYVSMRGFVLVVRRSGCLRDKGHVPGAPYPERNASSPALSNPRLSPPLPRSVPVKDLDTDDEFSVVRELLATLWKKTAQVPQL